MVGDTRTLQQGETIDMRTLEIVRISDPNHRELALRLDESVRKRMEMELGPPETAQSRNAPVDLIRYTDRQRHEKRVDRIKNHGPMQEEH